MPWRSKQLGNINTYSASLLSSFETPAFRRQSKVRLLPLVVLPREQHWRVVWWRGRREIRRQEGEDIVYLLCFGSLGASPEQVSLSWMPFCNFFVPWRAGMLVFRSFSVFCLLLPCCVTKSLLRFCPFLHLTVTVPGW